MYYPMKLQAPLKDYIWGGTKLKTDYGKKTDLEKVSESWELACHKDGQSVIVNGEAAGQTLEDWLRAQDKSVLGTRGAKFPYFPLLIKLIDAKDNLSVQVHPDNDYAMRGFKQKISKEEFAQRIADNTLLEVCNRVPVHKGDVFFIPSGTLHAIGKGIVICEIQQNSNTTYRIYDYGRVGKDGKPRELHVEKAKDVTRLEPPTRSAKPLATLDIFADADAELLATCEYFTTYHFHLHGEVKLTAGMGSFQSITVTEGSLGLAAEHGTVELSKGETVFLPAGLGAYTVQGEAEFLISEV